MENLKVLISFTLPYEAHLAQGYLESYGMETFIGDELTVQVNNLYSNAIGGVKLLCADSDFEKCIELLKEGGYIVQNNSQNEFKIQEVKIKENTNKNICPFCSSENIGGNKRLNFLMVPVYFILGAILPFYNRSYKCFDCHKEWRFIK